MKTFITAILIISLACFCYADEELTLVDIISFADLDTTAKIRSINNIGDFNADGYDDLLIGIKQGPNAPDFREAAFLFYGGPDFDTEHDLIFIGEPNHEACYPDVTTGFGRRTCGLGDFNADGYDDIVISASGMCVNDYYDGRLYFYFGSPAPDTSVDFIIDGERYRDFLGSSLIDGDFNGDGVGDLFTCADNAYYGPQVFIYLGSDSPNNTRDYLYDYSYQEVYLGEIFGGSDLNGDGYNEFGWETMDEFGMLYIHMGGDSLGDGYDFAITNEAYPSFPGDVTGDSIDDALIYDDYHSLYICEGSEYFNLEPDYYMWAIPPYCGYPMVANLNGSGNKLITEDTTRRQFIIYNTGVPFDSLPYAIYDYHQPRYSSYPLSIGDINADGLNEFCLYYIADSLQNMIFLYSMPMVDIDDDWDNIPADNELLTCYPNPFNSSTIISYSSEEGGDIGIYDITGSLVKNYPSGNLKEGNIIWDGTNTNGQKVSSGIYFVKLQNLQKSVSTKLIFMK